METPDEIKAEIARLDYRHNLVVDPDNPVLVRKTWRDRFSRKSHWEAGHGA